MYTVVISQYQNSIGGVEVEVTVTGDDAEEAVKAYKQAKELLKEEK